MTLNLHAHHYHHITCVFYSFSTVFLPYWNKYLFNINGDEKSVYIWISYQLSGWLDCTHTASQSNKQRDCDLQKWTSLIRQLGTNLHYSKNVVRTKVILKIYTRTASFTYGIANLRKHLLWAHDCDPACENQTQNQFYFAFYFTFTECSLHYVEKSKSQKMGFHRQCHIFFLDKASLFRFKRAIHVQRQYFQCFFRPSSTQKHTNKLFPSTTHCTSQIPGDVSTSNRVWGISDVSKLFAKSLGRVFAHTLRLIPPSRYGAGFHNKGISGLRCGSLSLWEMSIASC